MDIAFTVVFGADLLVNICAHWFWELVSDVFNWIDLFVVRPSPTVLLTLDS